MSLVTSPMFAAVTFIDTTSTKFWEIDLEQRDHWQRLFRSQNSAVNNLKASNNYLKQWFAKLSRMVLGLRISRD